MLSVLVQTKSNHWSTKCYARHKSTDALHSTLSKLVDQFVEVYLGEQNTRPSFGDSDVITIKNYTDDEFEQYLKDVEKWIETDLKEVVGDSIALNHILEEMASAINQTLYLFTFS